MLTCRREATASCPPVEPTAPVPPMRLGLDAGYGFVSFPGDGPLFGGLAVRASWRPRRRLELALGTAALSSASASSGIVDATASIIPVRACVRIPFAIGGSEILLGPCVDASYMRVSATSTTTSVRSTANVMVGLGAEAETRLVVLGSAWLFARAAVSGVFNGERYEAAGTPLFDTSRLQVSGSIGAGIGLP